MVRKVTAMKVRDNLGQLLEEVYYRGDEVVIERAGRAMAVLVPVGRYEQFQQNRKERFRVLDRIRARAKKIPAKKLDAALDEAVRGARARR
jgi:prevent-host-death family protein